MFLLAPVLNDPEYVTGQGADTQVRLGCLLDLVNAFACVGTAVALYSVVKREHEGLALGFVASRMYEAAVILIGVVCLLAVTTLHEGGVPTTVAPITAVAYALVVMRNWTFLLGPSLAPAMNAALLGTLLYRARLVPRLIPTVGLIGAPLLLVSTTATLLGVNQPMSAFTAIATLPILWELALGLWMTFRGFDPSSRTLQQ